MRIADIYQGTLENNTLLYSWVAGNHTLNAEFRWPQVEQDLWDNYSRQLADMSSSDPLVDSSMRVLNRDYDYVKYYTETVPQQQSDRKDWWMDQTIVPASLVNKTYAQIAGILQDRVTLAQGMAIYEQELKEALHYQIVIRNERQEITVCDLIPGGYFRNQDREWSLRFLSPDTDITADRFEHVTVEIEVYDA